SALDSLSIAATTTLLNTDQVFTTGLSGMLFNTNLSLGSSVTTATLNAGTGPVDFEQAVSIGSKTLNVTADSIIIGTTSTITSQAGNLILRPFSTGLAMDVGGAGTSNFSLTDAELGRLVDGFSSVTIGRPDSSANLSILSALNNINDPFIFTTGGQLNISNPVNGNTNDASLSFVAPTGLINLNSSVSTKGQRILFDGSIVVGGSGGTIKTTGSTGSVVAGGNIDFTSSGGAISGTQVLTLDAGSGGTITSNTAINMSGGSSGLTIFNSGGATFNQAVSVGGTVTITSTTDNRTVAFNGNLSANQLTTSAGAYNLALVGGAGITLGTTLNNTGSVIIGDNATDIFTFAGGLTATQASLSLAGNISTTSNPITLGDVSLTANTALVAGPSTIQTGDVSGA
ncbi:MAG: hypothetical protein ACK47R_16825, partial [Planctomycetia bacterium]